MFFDNVIGNGKPQPRSFSHRFGGEEGVENFIDVLRRNTFAGIADLYPNMIVFCSRAHSDCAFVFDSVRRIDQQIHKHLIQLMRQTPHLRNVPEFLDNARFVFDLVIDNIQRTFQAGMQISPLPIVITARMRKIFEILNDLFNSGRAFVRLIQ